MILTPRIRRRLEAMLADHLDDLAGAIQHLDSTDGARLAVGAKGNIRLARERLTTALNRLCGALEIDG